ncbi:MAG TPA: DUF4097 family beta strand repeat-containing protein [Candidatus Saccharimonadales bacterium]|nr:DUF4097 family beta strand repeat-containing protein [Candidatus Saccharimonadales bacterium]
MKGEITISQGRDDRVVIAAWLQGDPARPNASNATLPLTLEQNGNHIHLGYSQDPAAAIAAAGLRIAVRIEAPLKTEVISSIGNGNLTIVGINGPVEAHATRGNISISYVIKEVSAQSESGNLDIEAVSGRVSARVNNGNISCTRIPEGASAETGEGDINLRVVGPSTAKVRRGGGRIDVGGARSTLIAATDAGDLRVKAVPHQDWQLTSSTGNIHIELPAAIGFAIDAITKTGSISMDRQDMGEAVGGQLLQAVNGGGKTIRARSEHGNIAIE